MNEIKELLASIFEEVLLLRNDVSYLPNEIKDLKSEIYRRPGQN